MKRFYYADLLSILILTLISISFNSCIFYYVKETHDTIISRRNNSILRFGHQNEFLSDGLVRTDGIYVDEYRVKYPRWSPYEGDSSYNSRVAGMKFFDDGTVFNIILYGEIIDSIKEDLVNFSFHKISIMDMGLFSINEKDSAIYNESYWRQTDFPLIRVLYPYQLEVDSFKIMDNNSLYKYNHLHFLSGRYVFIPCDIPITSHHPFKSKRWLWTDKKARKQYMREWKKVKKERKKSKIKYSYE